MFLPDKGKGVDGHSLPMDGLQDAMGLVGAWHLGQHSADGVSVSGVGQHRQMKKAAGNAKEQSAAGEQNCWFGDRRGQMLTGLPNTSSNHCCSLKNC